MGTRATPLRPAWPEALVAAAMLAPAALWAALDYRVWPWDQAQYAQITLETLAAFREGAAAGFTAMGVLFDFKAPGLTWLGVPYAWLGRALGRYEPALLAATVTWQLGTLLAWLWSAYLVSGSRRTALAVTMLLGSTPLFVGMSHQYLVEPLQTFAVALSFLLALRAQAMSREMLYAALCALAALAMAAKTSSPLYCGLPLLIAACVLVRRGFSDPARHSRLLRLPLMLLASLCLVLVAGWYVSHFDATFGNVAQATLGYVAVYYGKQGGFLSKLHYWGLNYWYGLFLYHGLVLDAALAGAGAGLALQLRRRRAVSAEPAPPATGDRLTGWVVGAAAIHLVAAFAVYSLQINDDTRFLEPLLPATLIVLAWACRGRRYRTVVASALVAAALMQFVLVYAFALGLRAPIGVRHSWLRAVERNNTRRRELQAVVALTCPADKTYPIDIVGVDYAWLSDFSANFYATVANDGKPACTYTSLGFAVKDLATAVKNVKSFAPRYFITMPPAKMLQPVDFLNSVSAPMYDYVAASPDWQRVQAFDDTVIVFRRMRY